MPNVEIRQDLRKRYFTDTLFHHVVNVMANLMTEKKLSANEMMEALEVAKAKYYLDEAREAEISRSGSDNE